MKITRVETLLHPEYPLMVWVRLHTDEGLIGLGETVQEASGVVARVIHDRLAPLLIGSDATQIERLWHVMFKLVHFHGHAGAEMRAISAVDIALWDLLGKLTGQPVYTLLGGACRERIPTYNTCGSFGDYPDHDRALNDPGGLARELLQSGIRAMKIWPFDAAALESMGGRITAEQVEYGVSRFRAIREAVGDEMEIALEGHCCWNLPSALRIARAVEPYRPMWLEELMLPDNPQATRELRAATSTPVVTSERLMTRWQYHQALQAGAADIAMIDINWTGGLSEARKIATLASAHYIPVAPHNPGGPVCHMVAAHFCAATVNFFIMESVRAFYLTWFDKVVTNVLLPEDGAFPLPQGPGLGVELRADFLADAALVREASVESHASARAIANRLHFALGNPYNGYNAWQAADGAYAPDTVAPNGVTAHD